MKKVKLSFFIVLIIAIICSSSFFSFASNYSSDYRYWSQGASDTANMRNYGCWVVAQAKLIYESGINTSSSFNPDVLMVWQQNNGYLNSGFYQTNGGYAPVAYASACGKSLTYVGKITSNIESTIWSNISKGYYSIICVTTSSGGTHYVMIANSLSTSNGQLYCYNSYYNSSSAAPSSVAARNYKAITDLYTYSLAESSTMVSVEHGYTGSSGTVADTITDTNAIVNGTVSKPSVSVANKFGIRIRRTDGTYANGWSLYHAPSKDYVGTSSIRIYFNMNEELGLTLTHATSYTYQLYAQVGGVEYWSSEKSFTTTGSHSYGSWTTTANATCTATGSQKRTCACGKTETQSISALGHNYSTAWTVDTAATCTTSGSKSYHCTRCGTKSSVTSIAATGHSYGAWQTTVNATCTAVGIQKRTCHCGSSETQSIAALGHSYGSWVTTKAATCTELGVQKKTCSACGASTTQNLPALGHDYSTEWTVDKAATCTQSGSKSHHCVRCSATTDNMGIVAVGHAWSTWAITEAATTEKEGLHERNCTQSGCGEKETAVIAKLAADGHEHKFGNWEVVSAATCTKEGKSERVCGTCNVSETITISSTGHSFTDWKTVKEATASSEGLLERLCGNCGEKESKTISKLPASLPPATPTPESETQTQPPIATDIHDNSVASTPTPTAQATLNTDEEKSDNGINIWLVVVIVVVSMAVLALAVLLIMKYIIVKKK